MTLAEKTKVVRETTKQVKKIEGARLKFWFLVISLVFYTLVQHFRDAKRKPDINMMEADSESSYDCEEDFMFVGMVESESTTTPETHVDIIQTDK